MPRKKLKIIDKPDNVSKALQETKTKVGKPKMPKHVLKINDWLYITCDKCGWMIMQVSDKINQKTGEKYPDKAIAYASTLDWIIHILAMRMTRDTPRDFIELNNKLDDIYELIKDRIPPNIRPKNLFKEYDTDNEQ